MFSFNGALFNRSDLKGFLIWWVIGWVWVVLVWYLSLTTQPPDLDLGLSLGDKVNHFIAYAWLMFWFGNVYRCYHARFFYAFLFIAMGIGLEILQGIGQVRQFEYYDMLANSIGVLIGFMVLLTPLSSVFSWIERRFFSLSK